MITLEGDQFKAFYYLPEEPKKFINDFVTNNPNLTEEAKIFMVKKVSDEKGPWSTRNHVKTVTQAGNKITVAGERFESFYHLPEKKIE